jgi:hypothetical protein
MKRDGVPGVTACPTSPFAEHGTNFEKALRWTSGPNGVSDFARH